MSGAAVLVAGGTGALGSAVVSELIEAGWAVTVADRREHQIEGAEVVQADLLDPEQAARVVEGVDGLRAVANLVGGFDMGPKVEGAELADFERMLRLNLVPAFNL